MRDFDNIVYECPSKMTVNLTFQEDTVFAGLDLQGDAVNYNLIEVIVLYMEVAMVNGSSVPLNHFLKVTRQIL